MMKWLRRLIRKNPVLSRMADKAKTFTLPGFGKVPVYDVTVFFFNEIKRDILPLRAAAIAFSFFIAIFPAIIFLITLIPHIPVPGFQDNLIGLIETFIPKNSQDILITTITTQRGDLLSFGFILALWFSTNGMVAVMNTFDKASPIFRKRSWIQKRIVAGKLTLLLFLLVIFTVIMIIWGNSMTYYLAKQMHLKDTIMFPILQIIRWLIILLLFFNSISFIYYYGPAVKEKWRFVSTGSTVATILIMIVSLVFSWYLNNFSRYNDVYGSIGTIIVLLLWIYANSYVLLIGFEINASIHYHRNLRTQRASEE